MFWILLSLAGAAFQALGSAVSKKVLRLNDTKNVIGFVAYTFAGAIFFMISFFSSEKFWVSGLSMKFWITVAAFAVINVLAAWCLYRSLEFAELNYVMPYMTLTSLSLILPPMFFLGEIPTLGSVFGMTIIVAGAILMNRTKMQLTSDEFSLRASNRKGLKYFMVTALCYTILPTLAKIAVQESSVLFASVICHLLVGFGFLLLLIFRNEWRKIALLSPRKNPAHLALVLVIGLIAVGENGSINMALSQASVAQVFAIKRLMPFFAFLIGYFYFNERDDLWKKIAATALMIVGAMATILL
ncbi:MAG: DMT family transporter [Candidatus Paceibacterota bacterium]|jgi:drug/metabolite transporter (DMT)-like permease|nr:DMT family transporter [Candidatus Paceibacterota bacterium]